MADIENTDGDFSAAASAIGYLYQCRYALLESLKRLRKPIEFSVSIETLDDVAFEEDGTPPELLQTKHHATAGANLSDASPDIWKTLRIWCEQISNLPTGTTFFLVTTSSVSVGSAAFYLRPAEDTRDVEKALERLHSTAVTSINRANERGYTAFKELSQEQRKSLLESVYIIDGVPQIEDLDSSLKDEIFWAVDSKFITSFLERLEGWWLRRSIQHLADRTDKPILGEEIIAEMSTLREQFKQDNLPIDDDIFTAFVDESGYQDRAFVHQLKLINIGNRRIFHAIRNYFRAFEQRSRWVREDLIMVGELDRYEQRLIEEWELLFERMREQLEPNAAEEQKRRLAQALYEWVESDASFPIRPRVGETFVQRGSFHILSDRQQVGWHPDFIERLREILESEEAA